MMPLNVIIEKVEELKSSAGKPYVLITDNRGGKFSVWPNPKDPKLYDAARSLKPGMVTVLTYDVKGQYKNVTNIVISESVEPPSPSAGIPSPFNQDKDKRIARESCIKSSIAFFEMLQKYGVKEIPDVGKVITVAEEFEKHVYRAKEE